MVRRLTHPRLRRCWHLYYRLVLPALLVLAWLFEVLR